MNETYEYKGLYARCITKDLVEIKTNPNDKHPIETRKPSGMSLEFFVEGFYENFIAPLKILQKKFDLRINEILKEIL